MYLVVLGAALVLWFIAQNRESLGKVMQQAVTWTLIFLGVIAAIGLWDDIRNTVAPRQFVHDSSGRIEVPRSADGHYYLTLDVNGQDIRFVIDTGATDVVLTKRDASRVGIDTATLAYAGQAHTANGVVATAPVRLESIGIGPVRDHGFPAWVNGGELQDSLLGMSYLQHFSSLQISGGTLVLIR